MKLTIAFVLAAAACGGSKPKTTSETHEMKGAEEHEKMSPALTGFHDVLAPRWHAAKGEQRMKDTCGALASFTAQADAIAKSDPPKGMDGAKWTAATKELGDAVGALGVTCQANDATAFEPAFEKVHATFHVLMESNEGEKHEEHGEHEEHEHKM